MSALDAKPNLVRRVLRGVLTVFAALWIFLEEWIWDGLKKIMAWVGRLPLIHWVEVRIARLPPYVAMALFIIPWLVLLPAKILALWMIGTGHAKSGVGVFVVAKVVGTALLARLFTLTKPALMTIAWFARIYTRFCAWRDRIYAYVKSMPAWREARAWITRLKTFFAKWYRETFGG